MGETDESVRDKLIMRWIMIVSIAIIAGFYLMGCASQPAQTITIERPVVIPGPPEYLPVPSTFFRGCVPPKAMGPTNGDLLVHDRAMVVYATCLSTHLTAIEKLDSGYSSK